MKLNADEIARYQRHGCVFPIPVLSGAELTEAQAGLSTLLRRHGEPPGPERRHNPHLYLVWAADLVRRPALLDAVESILGQDILLWRSTLFVKPAHHPSYVAWHQDSVYWDLQGDEVATAWIALTDSTLENGCVQVVEGSHREPALPHTLSLDRQNALLRGQTAAIEVPAARARPMELLAGQMSLHHAGLLHGSPRNASAQMRAGLAVRFLTPRVRPKGGRVQASLVRGVDTGGHFEHAPRPCRDDDPVALLAHATALDRYADQVLAELLAEPTPRRIASMVRLLSRRGSLLPALRYIVKRAWKGSRAKSSSR